MSLGQPYSSRSEPEDPDPEDPESEDPDPDEPDPDEPDPDEPVDDPQSGSRSGQDWLHWPSGVTTSRVHAVPPEPEPGGGF